MSADYLYNNLNKNKTALDAVKYFIRRLEKEPIHSIWFKKNADDNFEIKLKAVKSAVLLALLKEHI